VPLTKSLESAFAPLEELAVLDVDAAMVTASTED
jgi:hypothetical protein